MPAEAAPVPSAKTGGATWLPTDVDFIPIGVNHISLDGTILAANPAFERILGYGRGELVGRNVRDLHSPEDPAFLPRLLEERARLHAGEIRSISIQPRYRRKDGSVVWAEATIGVLRDTQGRVLCDVSAVVDISERKRAEALLTASEERYRTLIGLVAEWYWEQDDQFRLTVLQNQTPNAARMNEIASRSLGRTQWELDYLNMSGVDWAAHRAKLERHEPFHDLRLKRMGFQGRPIWLSMSGHPVFDEAGRFTGYRGITLDISERVRADQLQNLEHEVAAALAVEDDADSAIERVLRIVCESDDWDCGRYFLVDESGETMRLAGSWGIEDQAVHQFLEASRRVVVERGHGLSGRVWEAGRALWTGDIGTDPRAARNPAVRNIGIRGVFVFPITAEGRPIGLVSIGSRRSRQPDERLLRAADAIGSQVGQFLSRKHAEAALRQSEERFRGLVKLSSDWYWEQDAEFRFRAVTGDTRNLLGIDRLEGLRRWEIPGIEPTREDWRVHRATLEAHRPFRDFEYEYTDRGGVRHFLSVSGEPLFDAQGRFTGYRGTGKDITTRVRADLMQHLEHTIAAELASAENEIAGTVEVMRTICQVDRWDCARYAEFDAQRGMLRFIASWGIDEPFIERFLSDSQKIDFAPGVGIVGAAWQERRAVWTDAVAEDSRPPRHDFAEQAGIRSVLAFPAVSGDQAVGVMVFFARERREVDERVLAGVRTIGTQLGQFLERQRAEHALQQSNERFNVAVRATSDVIWDWDLRADTLWWNDNFATVFGQAGDLGGGRRAWYDRIHPEDYERVLNGLHRAIGEGASHWSDEYRFRRVDGGFAHVFDRGEVIRDAHGQPVRMIGAMTDTTERTQAEARIRRQAEQQRLIAEFGRQALGNSDLDNVLDRAVDLMAATLALDCSDVLLLDATGENLVIKAAMGREDDALGQLLPVIPGGLIAYTLAHKEPVVVADYTADARFQRSPRLVDFGLRSGMQVPIYGPGKIFGLLSAHARDYRRFSEEDVSFMASLANILAVAIERKHAEERLAHLARYDSLTGLPNRHLFQDRLVVSMAQARRNGWLMAVLFIDLDRFKLVNDTLGHTAGDFLLKEAAARLNDCVRSSDTVGRLGGDEFSAILSELAEPGDASLVAQKVIDAFSRPFHLEGGHETYVSASVGITVYPLDGEEAGTLVMNADAAMYRAKEQGRNNFQYFTREMNERALARVQLEAQLRHALDKEEFELRYQPRVHLATGEICGFEALLRWRHPQRGLLSPGVFIPVLEDTGLIVPVGEWAIAETCRQIARWQARGLAVPPVAVNLSARQFQQKDLEAVVRRIVSGTGVDPTLVQFEITESLIMNDPEGAARILHGLRDSGVKLSVDDFGTGYSSLAYLKRFPIDALKIDREFIRDIASDADDAAITRAIISLGHSLGLTVVAEGVETAGQLAFLRDNGCDELQGFLFSEPVDGTACEEMLREARRLGIRRQAA